MDNSINNEEKSTKRKGFTNCFDKYFIPTALFCLLCVPLILNSFVKPIQGFPEKFFGQDFIITAVNKIRYYVLKDQIFENLIATSNGWFSLADWFSIHDYQNTYPFSPENIAIIDNKLTYLCDFLTNKKIEFVFVVTPNKNTIYPEYIPSVISRMHEKSRLDQFVEIWDETNYCHLIDIRKPFLESKQDNQLYFSTDTHWNQNGVFIAQQVLTGYLSKKFTKIPLVSLSNYNLVDIPYVGDLVGINFSHIFKSDITQVYNPIEISYFQSGFHDRGDGVIVGSSYNINKDLPTAIIYHDSFINNWAPFLSEIFQEANYFLTHVVEPKMIVGENPEIVLFEITERSLEHLLSLPDLSEYNFDR